MYLYTAGEIFRIIFTTFVFSLIFFLVLDYHFSYKPKMKKEREKSDEGHKALRTVYALLRKMGIDEDKVKHYEGLDETEIYHMVPNLGDRELITEMLRRHGEKINLILSHFKLEIVKEEAKTVIKKTK